MILAFFPCTRFETKIQLSFKGELYQMKNYSIEQKLHYAMRLHDELNRNYQIISELVLVVLNKGLRMVIENPASNPHYLNQYWCIKPSIIDKNRRENGDYMKKPTQYWFIGCEPKHNFIFEPIEYVPQRINDYILNVDGKTRQKMRSEIHPQYASRFIRQYLIDQEDIKCTDT